MHSDISQIIGSFAWEQLNSVDYVTPIISEIYLLKFLQDSLPLWIVDVVGLNAHKAFLPECIRHGNRTKRIISSADNMLIILLFTTCHATELNPI